jgi:hypothetical protein
VVALLALIGAALFIVLGLGAAARIVHIGNLDALGLASKLSTPRPKSAVDWPDLAVRAVVPQPDKPAVVLLWVTRPGHDGREATLLVELAGSPGRGLDIAEPGGGGPHRVAAAPEPGTGPRAAAGRGQRADPDG